MLITVHSREDTNFDIHALAKFFILNRQTIFGGYVRDFLIGVEPVDLDILIHNGNEIPNLIGRIVMLGKVSVEYYNFYDKYTDAFNHYRFGVKSIHSDRSIRLDLVIRDSIDSLQPDADINKLTLTDFNPNKPKEPIIGIREGSLENALKNLHARKFLADRGMNMKRFRLMRSKGFEPI